MFLYSFVLDETFCAVWKSCNCQYVPEINMTVVNGNITYYGANDTALDASLNGIGEWNKEQVMLLCKRKLIFSLADVMFLATKLKIPLPDQFSLYE